MATLAAAALLAGLVSGPVRGQAPAPNAPALISPAASPDARPLQIDLGAAGLAQTLRKLRTRASLMMIVAHPDDEDSGMLAYQSRGQGARTMMLTLTRGEGGQNVMSNDFETALGLVRTQELLSADRYSGVEQYFAGVVDFGFAKSREEALEKWGHDRVLADVVRVVRMTRPWSSLLLLSAEPPTGTATTRLPARWPRKCSTRRAIPACFPSKFAPGCVPGLP